jgi:hypothetical protein
MMPFSGLASLLPLDLAQEDILCGYVFRSAAQHVDEKTRSEYLRYVEDELYAVRARIHAGNIKEASAALGKFDDLSAVMQVLQDHSSMPLCELRQHLRHHFQIKSTDKISLDPAICLAARLLYMLNVQPLELQDTTSGTRALLWNDELSLCTFVACQFPSAKSHISPREGRLDPYFTAANLSRICKVRIEWTDSLEDHLRLERRTNSLRIFPHKRYLLQLLKAITGHGERITYATFSPRLTTYKRSLSPAPSPPKSSKKPCTRSTCSSRTGTTARKACWTKRAARSTTAAPAPPVP